MRRADLDNRPFFDHCAGTVSLVSLIWKCLNAVRANRRQGLLAQNKTTFHLLMALFLSGYTMAKTVCDKCGRLCYLYCP